VAARTVKFADIGVSAQSGRLGRRYPEVVGPEQPDDPFEGVRLDDAFVRDAPRQEPSAEVRATRARAARLAHEAARSLAAEEQRKARRFARRERWRRRSMGLVAVAIAALVVTQVRRGGEGNGFTSLSGGFIPIDAGNDRPTPAPRASDERLLPLPDRPPHEGAHAFSTRQPDGDDPVAYDPCRPIGYVVNDRTAPQGAATLLQEAIADVSRSTGLVFEYEGLTDEQPVEGRSPFQKDRYGDRWAPVLVAWTDDTELDRLADRIIGIGGSAAVTGVGTEDLAYVSGIVALDGPEMARLLHAEGWSSGRDVVEHELGHLVGLDHVSSTRELMHSESQLGVTGFQAGDKVGLRRLGAGRCFDEL
jgi:hypothetical protein